MFQHAASPLEVDVHRLVDRAIVVVRGEVDDRAAPALRASLDHLASAGRVVIDLHGVPSIGASGLAVLVELHRRLGQVPEAPVVQRCPPAVLESLAAAGVDHLFDLRDWPAAGRATSDGLALVEQPPGRQPPSPEVGGTTERWRTDGC